MKVDSRSIADGLPGRGTLISYPFRSSSGGLVHVLSKWLQNPAGKETGSPDGCIPEPEVPIEVVGVFNSREELSLYAESLGLPYAELGFEPDYIRMYVENRLVPLRGGIVG